MPEIKIVKISDENYPESLKNIFDPPKILYVMDSGSAAGMTDRAVGVVGTRNMSERGRINTEKIVKELVKEGYTIVSGMALGVDAVAHWTAINNKGKTIAVLGAGVDIIYPPQNRELYFKIIDSGGAIISEIPLGKTVLKNLFAARNRIISGLCESVIVTEAQIKSGSLITARMALDQGKDVFCVPGSPGCDYLLDSGAGILSGINL
ncbi:MAG: DNA-processing protein DprA [bacterium]|nr:DNA-processing protein DprA [bacterium]